MILSSKTLSIGNVFKATFDLQDAGPNFLPMLKNFFIPYPTTRSPVNVVLNYLHFPWGEDYVPEHSQEIVVENDEMDNFETELNSFSPDIWT
ncbi:unnamed protein product [Ranitomeya imitator]|uniref:Uncharacterized protein n=1 Tax=Ranitomeya imitator TaxID=111125 RepID=A0ABN9LRR6_9NEOB|nr:unnamed protein product [Ranitomeya imitator]